MVLIYKNKNIFNFHNSYIYIYNTSWMLLHTKVVFQMDTLWISEFFLLYFQCLGISSMQVAGRICWVKYMHYLLKYLVIRYTLWVDNKLPATTITFTCNTVQLLCYRNMNLDIVIGMWFELWIKLWTCSNSFQFSRHQMYLLHS